MSNKNDLRTKQVPMSMSHMIFNFVWVCVYQGNNLRENTIYACLAIALHTHVTHVQRGQMLHSPQSIFNSIPSRNATLKWSGLNGDQNNTFEIGHPQCFYPLQPRTINKLLRKHRPLHLVQKQDNFHSADSCRELKQDTFTLPDVVSSFQTFDQ